MIKYRFNEEEYAKEILKNGFITKYQSYELKILVKYYKHIGKKPKERKELIYEFCEKYIENFNKAKYFRIINAALNHVNNKKNKLIVIKEISVADAELAYIDNLEVDHDVKKVVFSLLVLNKINKELAKIKYNVDHTFNYFGGSRKSFKELHDVSKIPKHIKINDIINGLHNKGVVDVTDRARIKLIFVDEVDIGENVQLVVKSFDAIGYYYDYHAGNTNVMRCEECDDVIKIRGKNQKMCEECSKKINKMKVRERVNKHRKNKM